MKCLIDPDLLFPPPLPGTLHFMEMALYDGQLARFNLKVSLSHSLMGMLWDQWSQVSNRQHQHFLLQILSRHLAADFPENIIFREDQVIVVPDFLQQLNVHQHLEWLCSMIACYIETSFNTGGTILATWDRPIFSGKHYVTLKYAHIQADIPLKRNRIEWDALITHFQLPPIPHNGALRVYNE